MNNNNKKINRDGNTPSQKIFQDAYKHANYENVVVEFAQNTRPYKGKVFAAVQTNVDDISRYCAGTVAKLIKEGYTGYLIRTTNDEKTGNGTNAENILQAESENQKIAKELGFTDVYNLYNLQHRMHDRSILEVRGRFIFIFRALKVDTVLSYNPRETDELDYDRLFTARAVEEACMYSGMRTHFPIFEEGGIMPYSVQQRYYYVTDSAQKYNRIIDIGSTIDKKINAMALCKSTEIGNKGSQIRKELAKQGKRLPVLGNDDETADMEYIRHFLLPQYSSFEGIEEYGLEYAERFLYYDDREKAADKNLAEYIKRNAVTV
ncbi:PIG-L deacetylase family protein [Candidatus Latescibacterota bacterium]